MDENTNKPTRHDFTRHARKLMNEAVRVDVIDAVELAMIVLEHGTNTESILEEISNAFYADRHDPMTRAQSRAWHESRDEYKALGLL